jgi:hypothetical protein
MAQPPHDKGHTQRRNYIPIAAEYFQQGKARDENCVVLCEVSVALDRTSEVWLASVAKRLTIVSPRQDDQYQQGHLQNDKYSSRQGQQNRWCLPMYAKASIGEAPDVDCRVKNGQSSFRLRSPDLFTRRALTSVARIGLLRATLRVCCRSDRT